MSYPFGSVLKLTRYDSHEDITRQLQLMKDHGLNTVVIWPAAFWWEEKGPDYPFATGKYLLGEAERIGIQVVMELAGQLTTSEYMPDFLVKPEYQTYKLDGGRERGQSSFGFVSYFHPEVKEIIRHHYQAAAKAYKGYSSLYGYDVFNETMFRSFDPYTMGEFQKWLKDKYGTIERLNQVWERTYSEFSQIEYEDWLWMSIMPQADYCMFRKASIARFMKDWCDAIREVDPDIPLIADNIHSMVSPGSDYGRPQDDYDLQNVVDIIGMSFYPKQVRGCMTDPLRWEQFDGYYDASGRKGFFISEMQTHVQALFNPTTCVHPYELKHWCLEAFAGGAKGLIYWMWRPFDKGLQTYGRGLVNYEEIPTERMYMAEEIHRIFDEFADTKPLPSKVGILYDPMSEDIQRRLTGSYPLEQNLYNKAIFGAYQAFFDCNVRADIVRASEMKNYSLIVITQNCAYSAQNRAAIREYVENGGHLIIDGKSGFVDEFSEMFRTLPGGELNDLIGEHLYDVDNEDTTITFGYEAGKLSGLTLPGFMGRDQVRVIDGQVVALFPDGKEAAVLKKSGKGSVLTFNTSVWYGYINRSMGKATPEQESFTGEVFSKEESCERVRALVRAIAEEYELIQVQAEDQSSLKLRLGQNEKGLVLYAFNYTNEQQKQKVCIPACGKCAEVIVPAKDVIVIQL